MVVLLIVQDVRHEQHGSSITEVLPPMRDFARLAAQISGLMRDRSGAVAGVLHDLALGHIDQSWAIGVAVPRHYATRCDRQFAKAKLTIPEHCRLLAEIDR